MQGPKKDMEPISKKDMGPISGGGPGGGLDVIDLTDESPSNLTFHDVSARFFVMSFSTVAY